MRPRPKGSGSCAISAGGTSKSSRILNKMKSVPEGDGNLLDNTCVSYAHEHAEAGPHKNTAWP